MTKIIDTIYSELSTMSASDQKIAQVVLKQPEQVVNYTISKLATEAGVSDASVTRFCHNLNLTGFHDLKIQLAQNATESVSLQNMSRDDASANLELIEKNKVAEIKATLENVTEAKLDRVLRLLTESRIVQVSAEGDTYPVAADAVYKFNQIGLLAIDSGGTIETAIAQTMNLNKKDCLLVISNSGEAAGIIKQIKVAKQKGMQVIAITNRADSPIALLADVHLKTAVRQTVMQSQYYFSRVASMTMIEALYLLLIARDAGRVEHIKEHEAIISNQKI
ncbi:MurR/RpiR family transcriptional regulator [Lactobacillus gallinarum]|uniref:Transcriptional regulator n=1 Tax=Lactobacillus gallinarum DSM 10532 = JCM 2011 TaxID=1423748 RepID=A0A0R1NKW9_9LACO|nr:MurR/RpiR family transcriptional regulator [Lactobacillus gallinarum]KRL20911.1 transcriptional regulator [Lactobacillus gallinarum DSM 10532 = JCM 2011]